MSLTVGGLEWEGAGGPPLTFGQKLSTLGGAAEVVLNHAASWVRWRLAGSPFPARVDLAKWEPPDSRIAKDAESFLREVSSREMVNHSLRTYWFSAVVYELRGAPPGLDRETLYVAAVLHDAFMSDRACLETDHCFTVACAREARRLAKAAGWDEARENRAALAITTNLNAFVPEEEYGPEAHFMRAGGGIDILAQEWKLHPENLSEILARCPRDGFGENADKYIQREVKQHPGSRFACLNPLFPIMMKRARFSAER